MRLSIFMPVMAVSLLVSACGSSKEDNQVTETRMDDLDSLEGTISDDMINTDQSTDEPPLEAAPAGTEPAKAPAQDKATTGSEPTEKSAASSTTTATTSETQ
ncbi:hypothetical protein [Sphingorhabdus sp.]|uniref:hypothetical protein n=1 Tax=Sphingorhabdus sp. TaxID=1902408 RepID=UPI00398352E2